MTRWLALNPVELLVLILCVWFVSILGILLFPVLWRNAANARRGAPVETTTNQERASEAFDEPADSEKGSTS